MNALAWCGTVVLLGAASPGIQPTAARVAAPDPGTSPLWGDLRAGPHRPGYASRGIRDATRPLTGDDPSGGYPLVLHYWYPAAPAASSTTMTFAHYHARDAVDAGLGVATPEAIASADQELKAFYERPFNFPFGAIEAELWARVGPTALAAVADAPPAPGRFPLVVGVGDASGNAVIAEYLASHGYVVALVSSPAQLDLAPAARMEWYVRDIELALATMRELPSVDAGRIATWGFSFAGMPALLAAMRSPAVDAVASFESAIFYPQYAPQLRGNPFYDAARLRVPFLHMMRAPESARNEQLDGFEALRYSTRHQYLLHDTALVHQDFGTHGMVAAVVLGKRPAALAAARTAQRANAEYLRHFLDATLRGDRAAADWLARAPQANGFPVGSVSLESRPARPPAPTAREFVALVRRDGIAPALARFHEARRADPEAALFQERTINALGYELLRSARAGDAVAVFTVNTELYPSSANTFDSLSEAYEAAGDSARAVGAARSALEVVEREPGTDSPAKQALRRRARDRVARLSARTGSLPDPLPRQRGDLA